MLGQVLKFFKAELLSHLRIIGVDDPKVDFPLSTSGETIDFADDALNLLMVNLEEENNLREADIVRHKVGGQAFSAFPEIRLSMYLLFVANRSQYLTSMDLLSVVIRYFQAKRVFTSDNSPGFPSEIEKLTVELVTLPFAQQNDMWNALRTSYKPAVLYKVKMVVFQQEEFLPGQPTIIDR